MHGYTTDGWENLFLAETGAAEAISVLVTVFVVSSFGLVPGQPRHALGAELLAVGVAAWSALTPPSDCAP